MSSGAPFFSVILPTFNRARMLRSALRTVAAQTFAQYEVLIADDGSTDGTPQVVEEFSTDARFHYIRSDVNRGVTATRNAALQEARGTWITNLDSDDFWLPQRLEAFARFIANRPETSFVFSNSFVLRFDRIVGLFFDPERRIQEGRVPGHYAVGEEQLPYITTNLAIPRALYEKYGYHSTEFSWHDNDLYARLLADGAQVGVIREPLAVRRMHEGQVTERWAELYRESLKSLEAGRTPPEIFEKEREKLAFQVAGWLLKGLRPREAREFLVRELGARAKAWPGYRLTYAPAPALAGAKLARGLWLRLKHHPSLAPEAYRSAQRFVEPLLADERHA